LSKTILYIHCHPSHYKDKEAFIKEQASSLSYKIELGKTYAVHYLLNNNLEFDERYESIQLASKKLNRLAFLKMATEYIKKKKCEYIIIHGLDYFLEATFLKWFSGTNVILQHHAEKTYSRKKAILMPLADKWIDAYLFNGKEMALPFLQKKFISSINKIYEVVEGSSSFQLLPSKNIEPIKQLVFIGRLNENKNLITLLKAITILKIKRSDFHLTIYYTSNELEQELKIYSAENKINDVVTFNGSIPKNEIERVLNQSDVFVSCSLYEGSGYSLIEALACGVFPIASRIPAFDFLLEGLNEKLQFNPTDEIELANNLHKVLDIEFKESMRQSIRNHFDKKCSNSAIVKQIDFAFDQLT
jgi:glycosyltransferase involved in cell wall biosynthesis